MKKLIASIATTTALTAALTLGAAAPAGADNLGPCNDGEFRSSETGFTVASGANYAKHHILPATLGNDAHKPGAHKGFSACNPSGR